MLIEYCVWQATLCIVAIWVEIAYAKLLVYTVDVVISDLCEAVIYGFGPLRQSHGGVVV